MALLALGFPPVHNVTSVLRYPQLCIVDYFARAMLGTGRYHRLNRQPNWLATNAVLLKIFQYRSQSALAIPFEFDSIPPRNHPKIQLLHPCAYPTFFYIIAFSLP